MYGNCAKRDSNDYVNWYYNYYGEKIVINFTDYKRTTIKDYTVFDRYDNNIYTDKSLDTCKKFLADNRSVE